jgi:hypothetical protein
MNTSEPIAVRGDKWFVDPTDIFGLVRVGWARVWLCL